MNLDNTKHISSQYSGLMYYGLMYYDILLLHGYLIAEQALFHYTCMLCEAKL